MDIGSLVRLRSCMPWSGAQLSGGLSLPVVTPSTGPTTAGATPGRATTTSLCLRAFGSNRGRCRCPDPAAGHGRQCLPTAPPRGDPTAHYRPREPQDLPRRWLHRHGHLDSAAVHTLDTPDHAGGWLVDASVTIPDWDRHGLERLVRYCARPPLSQELIPSSVGYYLPPRYHCPAKRSALFHELFLLHFKSCIFRVCTKPSACIL